MISFAFISWGISAAQASSRLSFCKFCRRLLPHRCASRLIKNAQPLPPTKSLPPVNIAILTSATPADVITRHAARNGLTMLGLQRFHRRRQVFGDIVLHVARHAPGPLLLLSCRG